MKKIEKAMLIEGPVASLFDLYIRNVKDCCNAFDKFKDETILFALLEYSSRERETTAEERVKYLFEKCCEHERINVDYSSITVQQDPNYYGNMFYINCKMRVKGPYSNEPNRFPY
jgi:hypothetical protein